MMLSLVGAWSSLVAAAAAARRLNLGQNSFGYNELQNYGQMSCNLLWVELQKGADCPRD